MLKIKGKVIRRPSQYSDWHLISKAPNYYKFKEPDFLNEKPDLKVLLLPNPPILEMEKLKAKASPYQHNQYN